MSQLTSSIYLLAHSVWARGDLLMMGYWIILDLTITMSYQVIIKNPSNYYHWYTRTSTSKNIFWKLLSMTNYIVVTCLINSYACKSHGRVMPLSEIRLHFDTMMLTVYSSEQLNHVSCPIYSEFLDGDKAGISL